MDSEEFLTAPDNELRFYALNAVEPRCAHLPFGGGPLAPGGERKLVYILIAPAVQDAV